MLSEFTWLQFQKVCELRQFLITLNFHKKMSITPANNYTAYKNTEVRKFIWNDILVYYCTWFYKNLYLQTKNICATCHQHCPWEVHNLKNNNRTSLVLSWLRTHLPMQGTWVQSLVQDFTWHRATKPENPQAPRACALRQEKSRRWEAQASQQRAVPACRN